MALLITIIELLWLSCLSESLNFIMACVGLSRTIDIKPDTEWILVVPNQGFRAMAPFLQHQKKTMQASNACAVE